MSIHLIACATARGIHPSTPPEPHEAAAPVGHPLDAVALDPQPLPPRELGAALASRFDAVALNPQPLPPRLLHGSAGPLGI